MLNNIESFQVKSFETLITSIIKCCPNFFHLVILYPRMIVVSFRVSHVYDLNC